MEKKSYRFKVKYDPFPPQQIEGISRIIGDTNTGLTGTEIGQALSNCKIPDIDPLNTKWKRLFNALVGFQNAYQVGNHVLKFIQFVMSPVLYAGSPETFRGRKAQLNAVLAFSGMEIQENGTIIKGKKAENLDDALQRSNRLKAQLQQRNVHPVVLEYCKAEIIQENYFHAVLEGVKSITSRIRSISGQDGDGASLVDRAFGGDEPLARINSFSNETERGEQRGLCNLLKGLFGMIRNPLAHEPKCEWNMPEQDAIDILTVISYLQRKLDRAEGLKNAQS